MGRSGMRAKFEHDWKASKRIPASLILSPANVRTTVSKSPPFYIYVLCRPDGSPFYVGKGIKYRALDHEAEARNTKRLTHKLNVIRHVHKGGVGVGYYLDSFFDDENECLARERELIAIIGRHDLKIGPLTNQTDGGEGTSNPSEESRQRRRDTLWGDGGDDPDRAKINHWFQKICSVESVPIKPVGKYKVEGVWRNRASLSMMKRQAGALAASAIANQIMLEIGSKIPRRMTVDGAEFIIENGVARDTLSSDMSLLVDKKEGHEVLELTKLGFEFILSSIDINLLIDAGIFFQNN